MPIKQLIAQQSNLLKHDSDYIPNLKTERKEVQTVWCLADQTAPLIMNLASKMQHMRELTNKTYRKYICNTLHFNVSIVALVMLYCSPNAGRYLAKATKIPQSQQMNIYSV